MNHTESRKDSAQDMASGLSNPVENEETIVEKSLSMEKRLRLYQARLKDALRREDYEEAAVLRDEMKKLKVEAE